MERLHIKRPEPLVINLEGRGWFLLLPPTRAQVREAIKLDRDDAAPGKEEQAALDERISRQLAALTTEAKPCEVEEDTEGKIVKVTIKEGGFPVGQLTGDEERELLTAIMCWHHGMDPVESVAVSRTLKKNAMDVLAILQAASAISTPTPPTSSPNSDAPVDSLTQSECPTPKAS